MINLISIIPAPKGMMEAHADRDGSLHLEPVALLGFANREDLTHAVYFDGRVQTSTWYSMSYDPYWENIHDHENRHRYCKCSKITCPALGILWPGYSTESLEKEAQKRGAALNKQLEISEKAKQKRLEKKIQQGVGVVGG